MKLTRHHINRVAVSELSSVRNAAISPTEAANLALSKGTVLAAAAKGIGDVALGIAEMQAEVEINNAVSDVNEGLRLLDEDVKNMPVTVNQDGTASFDSKEVVAMEADRRRSLISDVRGRMKSGPAMRAFDKHIGELNSNRNTSVQLMQVEREEKILEANSIHRTKNLVLKERWNDALDQVKTDVAIGVISVDAYNEQRLRIKSERDERVVTRVLLNEDATDSEMEMVSDALEDGTWPTVMGMEEPGMVMDDKDRLMWQGRVDTKLAGLDTLVNAQIKVQQDENIHHYLKQITGGGFTPQDAARIPLKEVGLPGIKYLVAQARATETGLKSLPAAVSAANEAIVNLMVNGAVGGEPEALINQIQSNPNILGEDQLTLINKVKSTVNAVSRSAPLRRILDAEVIQLTGLTTEDTYRGSTDDRRSERGAGEAMEQAFWTEALAMGSMFTEDFAINWVQDHKKIFYKQALSDTMAAKGFNIAEMPSNPPEAFEYIQARVLIHQELDEYWEEMSEEDQAIVLADEMAKIEILLRNVWE